MQRKRKRISDEVSGMLQEEVVYICPLGLSVKCVRFESKSKPFTDHHINGDPMISEYWNLIRICEPCHQEIHDTYQNNTQIQRQVRLKKRSLSLQWLGPLAVNVLELAFKFQTTSSMPSMVLKLIEKGYLAVENKNTFTVGGAAHVTLQDYRITQKGKELVEKLFRESCVDKNLFQR